jgi:hypothetical protein
MNILFALLSIIIIYPIIFVLPIGIKGKPKLFLLMISISISILGILSKNIIPLWQTILIMGALAGLSTILISKRMTEDIPVKSTDQKDFLPTKVFNDSNLMEEKSNHDDSTLVLVNEKKDFVEDLFQQEEEEFDFDFDVEHEPLVSVIPDNILDLNEILDEQSLEFLYEELNASSYEAAVAQEPEESIFEFEELEELVEMQEFENPIEPDGSQDKVEQPVTSQYLSEIEKLLLDEEENESLIETSSTPNNVVKEKPLKEIKLEKLY